MYVSCTKERAALKLEYMNTLGVHVAQATPCIIGGNVTTREHALSVLYLVSDVTSAADLERSTP